MPATTQSPARTESGTINDMNSIILTVTNCDGSQKPVAIASSLLEAKELALSFFRNLDPECDSLPSFFQVWLRGKNGYDAITSFTLDEL